MKRIGMVWIGVLTGSVLVVCSCGQAHNQDQVPVDALPDELMALQGAWIAASTNGQSMCSVVFSDYTIRLKYQRTLEDPVLKRNLSIKAIDGPRKLLLMHNDAGAWCYRLQSTDAGMLLNLEFYNDVDQSWVRVDLKREPALRVGTR